MSSVLPSLLGVVLSNLILRKFGADSHGVTGTIAQIAALLTLLESGFYMAANVALYRPYIDNDWIAANAILTAVKNIYKRIGLTTAIVAIIAAFLAPLVIKSDLGYAEVFALLLVASTGTVTSFLFLSRYGVLFSAAHLDYKVGVVYLLIGILSQLVSLCLVLSGANLVVIRLGAAAVNLLLIPVIGAVFRRTFPHARFDSLRPDYSIVKSTKNVFAQKLASLVFSSTDMLVVSSLIGAVSASIYAVYNIAFTFAKQVIFAIVLSPFNAFGQLQASDDKKLVADRFRTYQFIAVFGSNAILTTVLVIVLPFVSLFTTSVRDVQYISMQIAILFALSAILEVISNIYGLLSNSGGMFAEMKHISIIGAISNVVISLALVSTYQVSGVLIGTVCSYIVMNAMQMILVHKKQLNGGGAFAIKLLGINGVTSTIIAVSTFQIDIQIYSYLGLLVYALVCFIVIVVVFLLVGRFVFVNEWRKSVDLLFTVLKRRKGRQK